MSLQDTLFTLKERSLVYLNRFAAALNNRAELDEVGLEPSEIRNISQLYLLKYKYQLVVALVAGFLCFFVLYFILLSTKAAELTELKSQELSMRETYAGRVDRVAEIPLLEQDIAQIKSHSSDMLTQLPKDFLEADIVQQLYTTGLKNDLKINVTRRREPRINESFIIRPYEIETTGTYGQIERFCYDIGKLNLLMVLSHMTLELANQSGVPTKAAMNHEKLKLKMIAFAYEVNPRGLAAASEDEKNKP